MQTERALWYLIVSAARELATADRTGFYDLRGDDSSLDKAEWILIVSNFSPLHLLDLAGLKSLDLSD
jgi:hypothetical protein